MDDLATYLFDLIQNSFVASAKKITLSIKESDALEIILKDDGVGMTEEELIKATSPFYTTRKTRKVGLGLPLFKMVCEQTEGNFSIESVKHQGTCLKANLNLRHPDMPPLGNFGEMIYFISIHQHIGEFVFTYTKHSQVFTYDYYIMNELLCGTWHDTNVMTSIIEYVNNDIKRVREDYEIA